MFENWVKISLSSSNKRKIDFWEHVTEDHKTKQANSHALKNRWRWAFQRCQLHSRGLVQNEDERPWAVSISRSKVNRFWWAVLIKAWWKIAILACWTARHEQEAVIQTFLRHIFPTETLPGTFRHITPEFFLQTCSPNYPLSIVIGLIVTKFSVFRNLQGWQSTLNLSNSQVIFWDFFFENDILRYL